MSTAELEDGVPFWTERMYKPGGGQDHLGLGSVVTDRILPRLSPGINVLTTHPRYWSFYSFLLSEFWDRDLPRTKAAFREWYRPMECLYSVACTLCSNAAHRGAPVGSQKIRGLVASDPETYDPQFNYMKTTMGGFGLYYGTVMQQLGLVVLADTRLGLVTDVVTPAGQVVADAFRSEIADTTYYREWIGRHDESVPSEVLAEYGGRACLCRLRKKNAADRQLLIDAFLHSGNPQDASARRCTLQFMCEVADQTQDAGIDQGSFRRLIYYRADYGGDDYAAPTLQPSAATASTARRWRLYQAREYYNAGLNEMWRRMLCWGLARDGELYPVPMADVLASVDEIDFEGFARSIKVDLPAGGLRGASAFTDLIAWVRDVGRVTDDLDGPWDLETPLTEDGVIDWLDYGRASTEAGPDVLAAALTLLSFVAARLWRPELALAASDDWFPVHEGGQERLGMQRFLNDLRLKSEAGATVSEVVRWLTLEYVIGQHERVATAKLATTGDTFRFRREAGRLRFFPQDAIVAMNDSRYNALSTFLYELGWSGYLPEDGHKLSAEGTKLRSAGDLPSKGLLEQVEPA